MKIQLKRSGTLENGSAKAPSAEQLDYGELAVNFNEDDPSIFLKGNNNNVIKLAGIDSVGSFSGDYNELINTPTIGDGSITINAGNGLSSSGASGFSANQTGNTSQTLSVVAADSTINVSASGISVSNNTITPTWDNIQNKPSGNSTGGALSPGAYLTGNTFNGSSNESWNVNGRVDSAVSTVVVRSSDGDISARFYRSEYPDQTEMYGGLVFRNNNSNDNYFRTCTDPQAVKDWLGTTDGITTSVWSGTPPSGGFKLLTTTGGPSDDQSVYQDDRIYVGNTGDIYTYGGFRGGFFRNDYIYVSGQSSGNFIQTSGNQDFTLEWRFIDLVTIPYRFDSYGNFTTIGSITASKDISCSGDITAGGALNTTSDESVKENIKPITDALSKVEELNGVTFNYIEGDKSAGLIAQDVEKILPELVSENEDGIKSVAYGNLVGLLVEAIKELKAEIATMKGE